MATRIFDKQSFIWWESDDFTKWPKDSYYSWENISIRKDLWWVTLSPSLIDTGWSISWDITFMDNLEARWINNWWVLVCTSTWNVYLDWVLKQTISTWTSAWNKIIWIWIMFVSWVQYIYYVTQTNWWSGQIHRSTTDLATFTISHRSYTTSSYNRTRAFVIEYWAWIYFATWNKVIFVDLNEIVSDKLTLVYNEEIVWFTEFQNNFKVYSNLENTWIQYIWDWVSLLPDYRQKFKNQRILWIENNGAYDYAVLWYNENYAKLWYFAGWQFQLLRKNIEANNNSRILNGYMSIREWMLYISGWKSWESSNYWIYTYWDYLPWTAKSLIQEYSWTIYSFTFHCHKATLSYFATTQNKIYSISHNNPPSLYASSWYIVTEFYKWQWWEEMKYNKILVWFKLNTWWIKVYCRTDIDDSFVLIYYMDNSNTGIKKWINIVKTQFNVLNIKNFTEIQFKIELLAWTSNTLSPKVWRFTAYLDSTNTQWNG